MAVTNRETMLDDDDLTESPRPGQPASRLRRALDIARQSVEEPPVGASAGDAESRNHVPPETVTADTAPRAPLRPLESNSGAHPAAAATRRRPGRGLDALLAPNPVDDAAELQTWATAAQGWVYGDDGALTWRPIVTTSSRLDGWRVETYLGVVTAEAATAARADPRLLARARRKATDALLGDAVARGAHGVIALSFAMTEVAESLLVTATATAVTLAHRQ